MIHNGLCNALRLDSGKVLHDCRKLFLHSRLVRLELGDALVEPDVFLGLVLDILFFGCLVNTTQNWPNAVDIRIFTESTKTALP